MAPEPRRDSLEHAADARPAAACAGPDALPHHLVVGNRFGSYGFGAGLSGLLLAMSPFGHTVAWVLVVTALALGLTGYERYTRGGATNRDTSLVGLAMGWTGFVILVVEASAALNVALATYPYGS